MIREDSPISRFAGASNGDGSYRTDVILSDRAIRYLRKIIDIPKAEAGRRARAAKEAKRMAVMTGFKRGRGQQR